MFDVSFRQMYTSDRLDTLRHHWMRRPNATPSRAPIDGGEIELRLCRASDDAALERLAALAERPLPFGRLVVALVDGSLVAALPLGGGCALRDPFVRTSHLMGLLELRARQLRQPPAHGGFGRLLHRHA
jgi:hypothetical protein